MPRHRTARARPPGPVPSEENSPRARGKIVVTSKVGQGSTCVIDLPMKRGDLGGSSEGPVLPDCPGRGDFHSISSGSPRPNRPHFRDAHEGEPTRFGSGHAGILATACPTRA